VPRSRGGESALRHLLHHWLHPLLVDPARQGARKAPSGCRPVADCPSSQGRAIRRAV